MRHHRPSPALEQETEMLILTRGVGQTIRIGEDVAVTVVEVKGNQVRLGIAAPRSIAVNRQEVHDRIVSELAVQSAKHR